MFEIGKLTNIPLGYVGEEVSRSYEIDVSEWLEEFPGATLVVQCLRPVDKLKYFASTELQDGVLTWTVDAMEVKYAGRGFAQISAIDLKTNQEYKSRIVNITVAASLDEFNAEMLGAEDPAQKWVTKVLKAAEDANTAVDKMPIIGENGNWWLWDSKAGAHVDSGVAATGDNGEGGAGGTSDTVSWNNVTDKPSTYPPGAHTHAYSEIADKPSTYPPGAHTHAYSEIADKPSTYPPGAHTHEQSEVNGLSNALEGKADATHTHKYSALTGAPVFLYDIETQTLAITV